MHPVVELELALLTTSVRRSRTQLEGLLDPEFREVGASGRLWTREEIIADLVDGDEGVPSRPFRLRPTRSRPVWRS